MIGTVVANYKFLDKIGEGGMGTVYRAVDFMIEREVAIKVLRREFAHQPGIVQRFRAEATALGKLNHPNIATLYSFFRQGDELFMVMELVHGESIASVIARSGALPWQTAIPQFCQILEGIGYAHANAIVHRDIKPSNMMLTDEGLVKVMDFGIARVLGTERMTLQGSLIGTFEYMSPEHIQGQEIDQRSDIYSLGILLYEMLTGRLPFSHTNEYEVMKSQVEKEPPSPRVFVPNIPLPVEQAILRALAKNAEARFHTAGEFRNALLSSVSNLATVATAASQLADERELSGTPSEGLDIMAALKQRIKANGANRITSNEWVIVPPEDSLSKIIEDIRGYALKRISVRLGIRPPGYLPDLPGTPIIFGAGNPRAELMVVDQGPGLNEIQEGKPFRGRVGDLVNTMLSSIGVSRDECYLTYAIKYREDDRGDWDDYWFELQVSGEYPDERDSPDEEGFRPYLLREVLTVSPRVILSFGGLATRTLLRTDESISELRGSLHTLCLNGKEFSVVPTFRPGLLLELPEKKNEVFSDLRLVMDCLASRNVGQE